MNNSFNWEKKTILLCYTWHLKRYESVRDIADECQYTVYAVVHSMRVDIFNVNTTHLCVSLAAANTWDIETHISYFVFLFNSGMVG